MRQIADLVVAFPKFEIHLDEELCIGCEICREKCHVKVYWPADHNNSKGIRVKTPRFSTSCVGCLDCIGACPVHALSVRVRN